MAAYETDLYEWTKAQADALRRRASNERDWDNLAEEIETLGRSERREILSRLKILLVHLLRWRHQPDRQCSSWRGSIAEARDEFETVLSDNPSLRALPAEYLARAYASARQKALDQTGLLRLPNDCPWTIDEILSPDCFP